MTKDDILARIWGMRFGFRLDELERAYKAARSEADRDRERLERDWAELEAAVARGEASFTEEDEDGQVIYDYGDRAGEMMEEVDGVLNLVREAFAISLHHLWERELNRQMKVLHYDEEKAFKLLKTRGLAPDEGRLKALRLVANVAKHSEGNSANKLFSHRPDFYDTMAMSRAGDPPGYDYLKVTDVHMDELFAAVRSSGPPRRRGWN